VVSEEQSTFIKNISFCTVAWTQEK